jgi:hypothetical protein
MGPNDSRINPTDSGRFRLKVTGRGMTFVELRR